MSLARALVSTSLFALSACGTTMPPCSAQTCAGCCDQSSGIGVCVDPVSATACGANGLNCSACGAAQACVNGSCAFVPDQLPTGAAFMFVTSGTFNGDLGGLAGADAKCQSAAAGAGLTGTFKAWISDSRDLPNDPARPTVNAFDRISTGPNVAWYLTCRDAQLKLIKAFNNKANLASTPVVRVDCNERGERIAVGDPASVWTGTQTGGTAYTGTSSGSSSQLNCRGWTDAAQGTSLAEGQTGSINEPVSNWTSGGGRRSCVAQLRLYCFQT